jgi:hypothetical protein
MVLTHSTLLVCHVPCWQRPQRAYLAPLAHTSAAAVGPAAPAQTSQAAPTTQVTVAPAHLDACGAAILGISKVQVCVRLLSFGT